MEQTTLINGTHNETHFDHYWMNTAFTKNPKIAEDRGFFCSFDRVNVSREEAEALWNDNQLVACSYTYLSSYGPGLGLRVDRGNAAASNYTGYLYMFRQAGMLAYSGLSSVDVNLHANDVFVWWYSSEWYAIKNFVME